ncbi:MAG: diacylglycerol kinase family protein [Sphingomicrobium sp.]
MAKPAKPLTVLINQGGGSAGEDASTRVTAALKTAGVKARIVITHGADCAEQAAKLVKAGAPIVVAAGGDGTMSAVAGALAGSDTAMGILPLGTLNHLARDLGIPFDLAEAAAVLAAGHQRCIDVGELNGRVFVNNSAIGLYPLMVLDREGQQKRLGRSKRLALLVASVRTLLRFRHQRLLLKADEGQAEVDTPLLFVGNNDDEVALPAAGKRASLDDGTLCVLVLRKPNRAGFLAAVLRAMVGRAHRDDMIRLATEGRLRVDSHRSHLAVAVDGETLHLQPPLDYRIRKQALRVIAPAA